MIPITDHLCIQSWEYSESFQRAGGPGGQHVNKVSTAVLLRFEAMRSPSLDDETKRRLRHLAGRRWTQEGVIIIEAAEHRSQRLNRELAKDKLAELIRSALIRPKRRRPTRPTLASQRRRVDNKTRRGALKATRRLRDDD